MNPNMQGEWLIIYYLIFVIKNKPKNNMSHLRMHQLTVGSAPDSAWAK